MEAQKARGRGWTKGKPPTSSGNLCTFSHGGASLGHLSRLDVCEALEKMLLVHIHLPPHVAGPQSHFYFQSKSWLFMSLHEKIPKRNSLL